MILSNIEIHKALDAGRLIIDPEPTPRTPEVGGPDCPYGTSSVDLKLNKLILVPLTGEEKIKTAVDSTAPGSIIETIAVHYKERLIYRDQPFHLKPGGFVLGKTIERVGFPVTKEGPNLAARIEGRSGHARWGLIVHCTAPTVHSAFTGTLTLELANLGKVDISLTPDMYIAQLIIEQVLGEVFSNPGVFQDQATSEGR